MLFLGSRLSITKTRYNKKPSGNDFATVKKRTIIMGMSRSGAIEHGKGGHAARRLARGELSAMKLEPTQARQAVKEVREARSIEAAMVIEAHAAAAYWRRYAGRKEGSFRADGAAVSRPDRTQVRPVERPRRESAAGPKFAASREPDWREALRLLTAGAGGAWPCFSCG
jgi:hypothetical protein